MLVSSISGAEGRLFASNSATKTFATAPLKRRNDGIWNETDGTGIKQVSRDDYAVCAVTTTGTLQCKLSKIEFDKSLVNQDIWTEKATDVVWASISDGRVAMISTLTQDIFYAATYKPQTINWRKIQSNLGKRLMKQVVLDGQRIGALDAEGNIFMADLAEGGGLAADGSLTKDPRWFQLIGRRARYLEMKYGHVLIISEDDGRLYYSNDYRHGDRWENVPLPSTMNEVFKIGSGLTKAAAVTKCASAEANGSSLATRAQLEAAWKRGANWCAPAWTTDGGKLYPNNEDTTESCGGNTPGIKGGDTTGLGDANCFGKKPVSGTSNVSPFNSKFWNAPPIAIEFVTFSSVPSYCGQSGIAGTYKGERFRFYTREDCTALRTQLPAGLTMEYNAANGECVFINSITNTSQSLSRTCYGLQDNPNQTLSILWNNGSGGLCIFNPDEYRTKYNITGDIGVIYEHWLNTGLAAGYSPCGDINPFCRWDPDVYYEMNPDARKEQPLNALDHYKQKGIKRGSPFCKTLGHYSLSDSLKQMLQDKIIVTPPADITSKCTSTVLDSGTMSFQYEEVFLVDTPVTRTNAAATCSAAAPGAKVATVSQMRDAQLNSANWCKAGWTAAEATQTILPRPYFVQAVAGSCVSSIAAGVYEQAGTVPTTAPVNCFGVKPATPTEKPDVRPFNANKWSQYSKLAKSYTTRRWTCSTRDAAELLFNGPSSAEETYLDKNDTVCFLEDSDQKTYACQSFQEYKNGEDYTVELADSYSLNCDTIKNTLRDLSTTLTAMTNIQTCLRNGQISFQESATNLNSVMTKYNCSSTTKTPEITRLCNTITQVRDKMLGYANSIQRTSTTGAEGVLDTFTGPIQNATNSRDKLLQMKTTLGCPA